MHNRNKISFTVVGWKGSRLSPIPASFQIVPGIPRVVCSAETGRAAQKSLRGFLSCCKAAGYRLKGTLLLDIPGMWDGVLPYSTRLISLIKGDHYHDQAISLLVDGSNEYIRLVAYSLSDHPDYAAYSSGDHSPAQHVIMHDQLNDQVQTNLLRDINSYNSLRPDHSPSQTDHTSDHSPTHKDDHSPVHDKASDQFICIGQAHIRDLLPVAISARSSCLWLGESGVGKTRMLTYIAQRYGYPLPREVASALIDQVVIPKGARVIRLGVTSSRKEWGRVRDQADHLLHIDEVHLLTLWQQEMLAELLDTQQKQRGFRLIICTGNYCACGRSGGVCTCSVAKKKQASWLVSPRFQDRFDCIQEFESVHDLVGVGEAVWPDHVIRPGRPSIHWSDQALELLTSLQHKWQFSPRKRSSLMYVSQIEAGRLGASSVQPNHVLQAFVVAGGRGLGE